MEPTRNSMLQTCRHVLQSRIVDIRQAMASLGEAMENENKSPMGDKHETARARLQFEENNLGDQLNEALDMQDQLTRWSHLPSGGTIYPGHMVETNRGYFFIGVALGKMNTGEFTFHAISPESPLGQMLVGSALHDEFSVNGNAYRIMRIF